MRITVLGASGGIGRAITAELAVRGHAVTAASRSIEAADLPAGVRALPTDLRDPRQAAAACRGAEVVVMAAQVPYTGWATELGPLVDAAVDATATAGARLVMADNLYMYGSPGTPITEATPEAATTRKGKIRRDIGQRILHAHAQGRVRAAVGRFSDYYGAWGTNSLVFQLGVQPAIAGKPARGFIALDEPHTFHYLPDAARGFAELVEQPAADGRAWILPAAAPVTQRELYTILGRVLGRGLRIGRLTPAMLWLAGLWDGQLKEAREVVPQFDRPYVTDSTAFEGAFGPIETTPHTDALAATAAWAREAAAASPRGGRRDRSAQSGTTMSSSPSAG